MSRMTTREAIALCRAQAAKESGEGWTVITPLGFARSFGIDCDAPEEEIPADRLRDCMKAELAAIPHLDAIYLLRGWERSEGARAELKVAIEHGKQILLEGAGE